MQTVLLDGDVVLYAAVHGATTSLPLGDFTHRAIDMVQARERIDHEIETAKEHFGAKRAVVALSWGGSDWRRDLVDPDYKASRRPDKPIGWHEVRKYIEDTYRCLAWEPLEADDVLGLLSTCPSVKCEFPGGTVTLGERMIVSIDKDMRTIPGVFSRSFQGEVEHISEEDANRSWMIQTLTGDRTDGYFGVPKVGPVKAERILEGLSEVPEMWLAVVNAYRDAGLTTQDALRNARCARILRWGEYDFENKEPKLWEPH